MIVRLLDFVPVDFVGEAQMLVLQDNNGTGIDTFQRFQFQ